MKGGTPNKIHREVLRKGVGKTSMWPQVALGTRNETVLMPGSRTLIFQTEISSYITLGNSVGNMNCALRRLRCEKSRYLVWVMAMHPFFWQHHKIWRLFVSLWKVQRSLNNPVTTTTTKFPLPTMGFKYYIAQGSVSENSSYLFFFFNLCHVIAKFTHVHAKRKFSIFSLLRDIMKVSKMPYCNVINLTILIFLLCSRQETLHCE